MGLLLFVSFFFTVCSFALQGVRFGQITDYQTMERGGLAGILRINGLVFCITRSGRGVRITRLALFLGF